MAVLLYYEKGKPVVVDLRKAQIMEIRTFGEEAELIIELIGNTISAPLPKNVNYAKLLKTLAAAEDQPAQVIDLAKLSENFKSANLKNK